jgi:hypothetical protein
MLFTFSAWRPLSGPLYDWPLAVIDATSMDCNRDLIASDNVYPHQVSETYNVFYHPDHRWYYLSQHQPNEVLLFKSFDSRTTGDTARGQAGFPPSSPSENPADEIQSVPMPLSSCQTALRTALQGKPSNVLAWYFIPVVARTKNLGRYALSPLKPT